MVNQFGIDLAASGAGLGVRQVSITLSGTTQYTLITEKRGAFDVEIHSTTVGGPSLHFTIARANNTGLPSLDPTGAPATDTNALGVEWPDNGYIKVNKSLASYNGTYIATITGE